MADGALTLMLDNETAARLAAAAEQAGMTPEAYATERLSHTLWDNGHDWSEAERRLTQYDQTGQHISFEEWSSAFEADVKMRLTSRS